MCANFQLRAILVAVYGMELAYAAPSANAEDHVDELVLCAVLYYFDEDECRDPLARRSRWERGDKTADGGGATPEQGGAGRGERKTVQSP